MVRKSENAKITKTISQFLRQTHIPNWLLWVLILVFILRVPSFFEPFWYGDEAIYLTMGEALRRGLVFYRDIYDNKPPLLYILAAISGNVFWFRVMLTFWVLAAIYFFWRLSCLLFEKNERLVKIATFAFGILTSIPLLEGNIANAEVFMIGPIIFAFWLLLEKGVTPKKIFLSGLLLGIATLFKVPAAVDSGAIAILWLVGLTQERHGVQDLAKRAGFLIAGFLLPILASLVYYWALGALPQYINAALLQNMGYLSSWRVPTQEESFLGRNTPLIIRFGLVLIVCGALVYLWKKKKIGTSFLFVGAWFVFSLFGALLSERPYPHYLIQVIPPFSLLLGMAFAARTSERFYPLPLFTILGLSLIFYKFGYYAVSPYYENFLLWTAGRRSTDNYFASFDRRVPRNYQVAGYITRHTQANEPIFVWGNDSAIYALTRRLAPGRFVAAYHINDFVGQTETISAIRRNPPSYIVVITEERDFPELSRILDETYILVQTAEDAQIYKKVSQKVKGILYSR